MAKFALDNFEFEFQLLNIPHGFNLLQLERAWNNMNSLFFQHSGPGRPLHSGEQFHLPAFLRASHPLPELVPSAAAPPGELGKHLFPSCQTELYNQRGFAHGEIALCHFVLLGPSDFSNPHSYLQDHSDAGKSRQVQICECPMLLSWNHFQLSDGSNGFFPVFVTLFCLSRPISKSLTWPHFTTTSMSRNTLML